MAVIENLYTGDGTTVLFSFTFEYIEEVDVEVSIDAVTIATTEYSLANSTTIEFNTAPASSAAIRIYRNTTVDTPKATFFPGSAIRAQDLNDNFEQILFVTQEADAISERAEIAADQAQIATTAALAASATATTAATSAQTAASTAQAQVNAAQTAASDAAADAATAASTASSAVTTANNAVTEAGLASTNATAAAASALAAETQATSASASAAAAQTSANTASVQATSAAADAAIAQTSATTASTQATQSAASAASAASDAATALSTSNTASTDASTALTAANNAVSTANAASTTATTASNDASSAVLTANGASTAAQNAVTTSNQAASDATAAVSSAATANTTANGAVTTANGAVTTANGAVTTANSASTLATSTAAAVADAYLFDNVLAVANIPSNPSDEDAVRVVNSTNIESTSSVQNVPSGFVGDPGINVEIIYSSSAGKWNYLAYNANDPDDRYGYPPYVDVTRQNTVDAATLSGVALNSTNLGTFTGSTIADSSTIKSALQDLETEVETKADLVGGVVPTSQLPALAITTFLGSVANQTAMLALSGQRGDFAIRTDTGSTFVLTSDGGSTLSDWQELETPTIPIQTVNGQTGTVVLGPSDVNALATAGGTMTGNITFNAGQTFDGRDVSADGTKLDGIESGATADQTDAEIRAAVEAATDSNVFTDADHTKLNGIESGATADQTASEILTAIKTVDGAGSGLDADLLDGITSSSFLRSDTGDTASGDITFSGGAGAINIAASSDIRATTGSWTGESGANTGKIQYHSNHWYFQSNDQWIFRNGSAQDVLTISTGGNLTATGNVTAFSDIRLKKDIEVIPHALDKVLSLRGVTYTDKETEDRRTGVIAQDVQAVLPEAVKQNEEYLSVAYGNLVGLLIESIKELEARVSELELL